MIGLGFVRVKLEFNLGCCQGNGAYALIVVYSIWTNEIRALKRTVFTTLFCWWHMMSHELYIPVLLLAVWIEIECCLAVLLCCCVSIGHITKSKTCACFVDADGAGINLALDGNSAVLNFECSDAPV